MKKFTWRALNQMTGWGDPDFLKNRRVYIYWGTLIFVSIVAFSIYRFMAAENGYHQGRALFNVMAAIILALVFPNIFNIKKPSRNSEKTFDANKFNKSGWRNWAMAIIAACIFVPASIFVFFVAPYFLSAALFEENSYYSHFSSLNFWFYFSVLAILLIIAWLIFSKLTHNQPAAVMWIPALILCGLLQDGWLLVPVSLVHRQTLVSGRDIALDIHIRRIGSADERSEIAIIANSAEGIKAMTFRVRLQGNNTALQPNRRYRVQAKIGPFQDVLINASSLRKAIPSPDPV